MTLSLPPSFSLALPLSPFPFPSHSPSPSHFPSPSHCYISCPSISSHNPLPPPLLLPLPLYLPLSFFNSTFQAAYLLLPSPLLPFSISCHSPITLSLLPSTPPSYLLPFLLLHFMSFHSVFLRYISIHNGPTYKQLQHLAPFMTP